MQKESIRRLMRATRATATQTAVIFRQRKALLTSRLRTTQQKILHPHLTYESFKKSRKPMNSKRSQVEMTFQLV